MTPQYIISQLLESDSKNLKNIRLLKKIILAAYFGRLQINGQSPDNTVTLGNYLFDNERVLFDFTRLSDQKKEVFKRWMLGDHQIEKTKSYFKNFAVNEYRGFTCEVKLSWWGRLKRWLQNDHTEYWRINEIDLSLKYQLLGIDMCHGQEGVLIGFDQLFVPPTGAKYKALNNIQTESLGNTKRVFITDNLVEQLTKLNLNSLKFEMFCKSAHPLSVSVDNLDARHKDMLDFRRMQKFDAPKPWYIKVWEWFRSLFKSVTQPAKAKPEKKTNNKLILLYENDITSVYQRSDQKILIKERRPDIENLVYCGGGIKIFAHIGVWKALNEANIIPKKFAGSSAGAIMALMCYLGYKAQEIADLFKYVRKEHLVYFDLNRKGISDPRALKTALDFAIAKRVHQIVTKYNLSYPEGPITFATLEALKVKCPGCGLGNELIVTATNKRLRKTKYFSFYKTPNMEISQAVKVSASVPVVFRDTRIDGYDYNDGGILNNFPTDAFYTDDTTFLESEYGNNMKTLAVQFDNGTERATVDRGMDRVYRENFILNWIYGLLTGVRDPASGWEQDRMKLRKYAAQSIIVDVGNTFATDFSIREKSQIELIKNGYQSARDYLRARYAGKSEGIYKNQEIMHSTFASLEELLAYCCYKGNKYWFEIVFNLIKKSSFLNKEMFLKRAIKLKSLYFNSTNTLKTNIHIFTASHGHNFFGNGQNLPFYTENKSNGHLILLALYPIFLKLTSRFISNEKEHDLLERARHSFTEKTPFNCLTYFELIKDETHILFHIFHILIKELRTSYLSMDTENVELQLERIYENLKILQEVLYSSQDLFKPEFYAAWNVTVHQGVRVLHCLKKRDYKIMDLFEALKCCSEPLEAFSIMPQQVKEEQLELQNIITSQLCAV